MENEVMTVCPNCSEETFNGVICDSCGYIEEQEPKEPIPD